MPGPLSRGVGVFSCEGFGDMGFACSGGEILLMPDSEGSEVLAEGWFESSRESDDAVFGSLAVVDGNGALAEIEIFDAEAHGLH